MDKYNIDVIHLSETTSTNDYLKAYPAPMESDMTVVVADYQTSGRGQASNKWESERGKNLLFSVLTVPDKLPMDKQFVLSMAGALALKATLDDYCDGISLKWPNDIYWHNSKISGTLIETSVRGKTIERCIYGIGLNVNQRAFHSDAPNPVSLYEIIGRDTPLEDVLRSFLNNFVKLYDLVSHGSYAHVVEAYNAALFRLGGIYTYEDTGTCQRFEASIDHVGTDGLLRLIDTRGNVRKYTLKGVRFIL